MAKKTAPSKKTSQAPAPHTAAATSMHRALAAGEGARQDQAAIWTKEARLPENSKNFDTLGPITNHMHQNNDQAALVGQQGKQESYYLPPQLNTVGNNFPYTFIGLEPGTTKSEI